MFVSGSMINTLVLLYGIPYILPLGANIPPNHLVTPVNPVMVVVSDVFVSGSMIKTLSLRCGIPYILPLFAKTSPYHLLESVVNPVIVVVSAVFFGNP